MIFISTISIGASAPFFLQFDSQMSKTTDAGNTYFITFFDGSLQEST